MQQLPFTKDGTIHGILADQTIWHGKVDDLTATMEFVLMVALTNNQYSHPLLERYGSRVDILDIGLGVSALVVQNGLVLFKPTERQSRSTHRHSGALYLYSSHHNNHCTLLQVLPPYAITSCHYHQWITEDFFSLIGNCRIGIKASLNGSGVEYFDFHQGRRTVPERVIHQMANPTEQFAVNFLVMRGLEHPLQYPTQMDDHHYVEPSPFTFSPSE